MESRIIAEVKEAGADVAKPKMPTVVLPGDAAPDDVDKMQGITDDADNLTRIVAFMENEPAFSNLRLHNGGITVLEFYGDELVLSLRGNCMLCKFKGGPEATQEIIVDKMGESFPEVTVRFQPGAEGAAPKPAELIS